MKDESTSKSFRHDNLVEIRFSLRASKKYALELGPDLCGLGQGSVRGCCKGGEVPPNYMKMESFSTRCTTVRF